MISTIGPKSKHHPSATGHYFKKLGLQRDPFTTSPDPAYFFPAEQHYTCLAHLEIAIRLRRGANLVLGEIGTGKTTLCRRLIQIFAEESGVETHLLIGPAGEAETDLLQTLSRLWDLQPAGNDPQALQRCLKDYLYEQGFVQGRTILLIIDEAQKLSTASIEALRGLLNYETNEFKLLQLILFGQLELKEKLRGLPNFVDRLNYKCALSPLSLEACRDLIAFRLRKAGYRRRVPLFTDPALDLLHAHSGGYPRKVCNLAHHALERLLIARQPVVDIPLLEALIREDLCLQ